MKILIPVLGFGKSGGYRVLSKFADLLISNKVEVDFISFANGIEPYFPTAANIYWIDKKGKVVENKCSKNCSFYTHLVSLSKGIKILDRRKNYDIIFANQSLTVFPVLLSGRKKKAVYYVQAYEPEFYKSLAGFKNYILSFLSLLTYKLNLFTIVNADIYKNYKQIKTTRVLYPGIDFKLFYPNKHQDGKSEKIIVGTIGRSEAYKGTNLVREAYVLLKKTYPQVELHVGFGNEKDFENVPDVKIITPKNDKELGEYYRSLDFYVCAGFIQLGAFHYPVVEAMSCKVSVVSTQYYPVNDSNAYVVYSKDKNEIVSQLECAIKNKQITLEKSEKALDDVQHLNWTSVGEKLLAFLNEKVNCNLRIK